MYKKRHFTGKYHPRREIALQTLICKKSGYKCNNRGKCLLKLKYYDEAILDFQQAISIKPKHAASHEYLAEGFRAIGEDELAQQHQDIADALRGGEDI